MTFDELYGEGALAEYAAALSDFPLYQVVEDWPRIHFTWEDGSGPAGPGTAVTLEIEDPQTWHFKSMTTTVPRQGFLSTYTRTSRWALDHGVLTFKARPAQDEARVAFKHIGFVADADDPDLLVASSQKVCDYYDWKAGLREEPEWHTSM